MPCPAGLLRNGATKDWGGWLVVNFRKRQEAVSSTERVHQFRKRERNEDETIRYRKLTDEERELPEVKAFIERNKPNPLLEIAEFTKKLEAKNLSENY